MNHLQSLDGVERRIASIVAWRAVREVDGPPSVMPPLEMLRLEVAFAGEKVLLRAAQRCLPHCSVLGNCAGNTEHAAACA